MIEGAVSLFSRTVIRLFFASLMLLLALLFLLHFYARFLPTMSVADIDLGHGQVLQKELPLSYYNAPSKSVVMRFNLFVPSSIFPQKYLLLYVETLDSFTVNGRSVSEEAKGKRINLAGFLHAGSNQIVAKIHTTADFTYLQFSMEPSVADPLTFAYISLALLFLLSWTLYVARLLLTDGGTWSDLCVLLLGVGMRSLYVFSTPYYQHAFDWRAHILYVQHLAHSLTLPRVTGLNQEHQMPLYYFLASLPVRLLTLFGGSVDETLLAVQLLSLLLSLLTFIAYLLIARELFRTDTVSRIFLSLLIAVFPILVYPSSLISNDTLWMFFGSLWYLTLRRMWMTPDLRMCAYHCVVIALGLLTKLNAVLWMIVSAPLLFAAFSRTKDRLRALLMLAASGVPTLLLLIYRWSTDARFGFVANSHDLNFNLRLSNSWHSFLTFNPLQVFLHPFVSSVVAETRPYVFLESVFRLSQFGAAASLGDAKLIVTSAMLLLPLAILGFIRSLRTRRNFPEALTVIVLFAALVAFRLHYPFESAEHPRYIVQAFLPVLFFVVLGATSFRSRFWKLFAEMPIALYVVIVLSCFLNVLRGA